MTIHKLQRTRRRCKQEDLSHERMNHPFRNNRRKQFYEDYDDVVNIIILWERWKEERVSALTRILRELGSTADSQNGAAAGIFRLNFHHTLQFHSIIRKIHCRVLFFSNLLAHFEMKGQNTKSNMADEFSLSTKIKYGISPVPSSKHMTFHKFPSNFPTYWEHQNSTLSSFWNHFQRK